MKVIIAGSRTVNSYIVVQTAIEESGFDNKVNCPICGGVGRLQDGAGRICDFCNCNGEIGNITEVVSGCARGVDALGEEWAYKNHREVKLFAADWNEGPSAGPQRNTRMANYADALIAVIQNASPGTSNMIAQARQKGLKVFVYEV